jgi:hypothetical protein
MLMARSLSCLLASLRELPSTVREKLMLMVERLGALSHQILILQEGYEELDCYYRSEGLLENIPKCICGSG